jgi:hypothetical protein
MNQSMNRGSYEPGAYRGLNNINTVPGPPVPPSYYSYKLKQRVGRIEV